MKLIDKDFKSTEIMKRLYNITNILHLYYVDIDNQNAKYKIKTFSKEWWKFIWNAIPRLRIRIESYYK